MKIKLISILLLFLPLACIDNSTNVTDTNDLVGTWKWTKRIGGFSPTVKYPEAGEIVLIRITADNRFIESKNDRVIFSDNFELRYDSAYGEQYIDFIHAKRNSFYIIKVTLYYLVLWDGWTDGYFYHYTRNIDMVY